MPDNAENCTTCGPNGLKFSRHNGRGRIEVPQDFLAHKLGSIDAQIAEGMAMAERLAAARQKGDTAPATRPQQSYQQQAPSAPRRPTGNFTFDALTLSADPQQLTPPTENRRPTNNQFTLAETEHASLFGLAPPPGPPSTNQFTLAESGAADVFPGSISLQRQKRNTNQYTFGGSFNSTGLPLARTPGSPRHPWDGVVPVALCPPEVRRVTTFVTIALREQLYKGWAPVEMVARLEDHYRTLAADLDGRPPRQAVVDWLASDAATASLQVETERIVFPECKTPCQPIVEIHGIQPHSSRAVPYVESWPASEAEQREGRMAGAKHPEFGSSLFHVDLGLGGASCVVN